MGGKKSRVRSPGIKHLISQAEEAKLYLEKVQVLLMYLRDGK